MRCNAMFAKEGWPTIRRHSERRDEPHVFIYISTNLAAQTMRNAAPLRLTDLVNVLLYTSQLSDESSSDSVKYSKIWMRTRYTRRSR